MSKATFADNVHVRKLLEMRGYVPQPHQQEWHRTKTRFLVAVCGRQIGKTVAAVNELIDRAMWNPRTRNWYVTNDYKQAKRNVWDLFQLFVPKEWGAVFNHSELSIRFPNGSKIELIGVENAESLRGAVVHFAILDEYADFPSHVWPKVIRPMLSTTAGDVWFIGTPKGFNHFYELYNLDNPDFTKFRIPAASIDGTGVYHTTSQYADLEEIRSAHLTLPADAFNQEYMADFNRPSGTVYADWPIDNFKEVNYDSNLPVHISMDFGVNDPTSIIWLQPNGSEYRVIDYYEATDANIEHYVSVIRSKPYKEAELCTGDPAGKARTLTTGTSPIELMSQRGIYVRTKDGVTIPDQIRATHRHIKALYVDRKAERFRDCLLNYRYPEKSEQIVNQSNEIPIHDQYSHAMRALEYYFVNVSDFAPKRNRKIIGWTGGDPVTGFGRKPMYSGGDFLP